MEPENTPKSPFKTIEPQGVVPENLKRSINSEVDLIRHASSMVELFVGHFIGTVSSSFNNQPNDPANKRSLEG
jgi:hypothetical protein